MCKKFSFLTVLLCLALLLSACVKAEDKDNLFGLTQEELAALTAPETTASATEEAPSTTPDSEPQSMEIQEDGILPDYPYGNMQTNITMNFMEYGDKIVFSYYDRLDQSSNNFSLCTYDKETGEVRRFCTDAACLHRGDDCAEGGITSNLEQYKGDLYGIKSSMTSGTIKQVKGGRFEPVISGANFFHANDNLYVITPEYSLVVFEKGNTEPRTIIEEFTLDSYIIFGHYLYGCTYDEVVVRYDLREEHPQQEVVKDPGKMSEPIMDGYHIYYLDGRDTGFLWRCDMEGENPEQLTDFPVHGVNFDNDFLYFRTWEKFNPNAMTTAELGLDGEDGCTLYRMEKGNPENVQKIAELPDPIWFISVVPGYDKVFIENYSGYDPDPLGIDPLEEDNWKNPTHYYAVDVNTGEYQLLERPE